MAVPAADRAGRTDRPDPVHAHPFHPRPGSEGRRPAGRHQRPGRDHRPAPQGPASSTTAPNWRCPRRTAGPPTCGTAPGTTARSWAAFLPSPPATCTDLTEATAHVEEAADAGRDHPAGLVGHPAIRRAGHHLAAGPRDGRTEADHHRQSPAPRRQLEQQGSHLMTTTTDPAAGPADTAADEDGPPGIDLPRTPRPADRTAAGSWAAGSSRPTSTGAPTTTRQAEVLNTALIGSPTDERGVVIGEDHVVRVDGHARPVHRLRQGKQITSPNVCILGMIGSGKSSLIKTVYVERPLMLRRRRAVVIDKKLRDGEGEYAELTRLFGSEPYRFDPDDPGRDVHERARPGDPGRRREGRAPAGAVRVRAARRRRAAHRMARQGPRRGLPAGDDATSRTSRIPVIPDLVEQFPAVVERPRVPRRPPGHPGPDRPGRVVDAVPVRTAAGRRPGRACSTGKPPGTCGCTRSSPRSTSPPCRRTGRRRRW